MSLLFTEGFDHQKTGANLTSLYSNISGVLGFSPGRFGGQAISLWPNINRNISLANCLIRPVPSSTTLIVGFAFQMIPSAAIGSSPPLLSMSFLDGLSVQCTLVLQPTGFVDMNMGSASSNWSTSANAGASQLGASQTALYTTNQWNYCEVQITADSVNGAGTVRINGVNAISFANKRTSFTSGNTITNIIMTHDYSGGTPGVLLVDDMYCCNGTGAAPYNTFLGMCHVQTVYPTALGTYHDFTANNPTNALWQSVSETTMDGDNSYNTASNVGLKDTFTGTTSFTLQDVILAVQPKVAVRKDDTTPRQIQTYLKSGASEFGGSALSLTSTYVYDIDAYALNPMTNLPWTADDLNGLEFGYRIVQ